MPLPQKVLAACFADSILVVVVPKNIHEIEATRIEEQETYRGHTGYAP